MQRCAKEYRCGTVTVLFYYSESYRCEQVPRVTDVAPSQGWFYSESYRCEQVPRNTDVAPSQVFVL